MQETMDHVTVEQEAQTLYDSIQNGLLNSYWGSKSANDPNSLTNSKARISPVSSGAVATVTTGIWRSPLSSWQAFLKNFVSHHLDENYTKAELVAMITSARKQTAIIERTLLSIRNDSDRSKYLIQRFVLSCLRG
jgi:hypothetical protein